MASASFILKNVFGVQALTPTDPGIQKLAQLRTGVYEGPGQITITPTSEVQQLLGQAPDPLKNYDPFADNPLVTKLEKISFGVITAGLGTSLLVDPLTSALTPKQTPALPLAYATQVHNLRRRGDRNGLIRFYSQLQHYRQRHQRFFR